MSHERLSVVRKRILTYLAQKKNGDPTPVLQNQAKSVSQSIPSLDQSSPCKGDFLTYLSKLYIDNGITHVQLNLFGERFSQTLQTFAQDAQKPTESSSRAMGTDKTHL